MIDRCGRTIEYLRLSVIDRCNLRCVYCQPGEGSSCGMLTCGEILAIVREMANIGIRKVRITGGEPLVRKDLEQIVAGIAATPGIDDIPMTTNGIGLAPRLRNLLRAGITRLNISLDSLRADRYAEITKYGSFEDVWAGIEEAIALGVNLKINVVLIRGVNDDEISDFIAIAKEKPVEVRFIELMPIGKYGQDNRDKVVAGVEILAAHPYLRQVGVGSSGVAELYTGDGFAGKVGLIRPVSHSFCDQCNRVRVTSDGKLKLCLGDNGEVDLMGVLHSEPEKLGDVIRQAVYNKPNGHHFEDEYCSLRNMRQIGG